MPEERDIFSDQPDAKDEINLTLMKIWWQLWRGVGTGGSGSGGIVVNPQPVTTTLAAVGASATGTIPAGSKGWSFAILTGTATYGGATVAAGFSDSSEKTTLNAITFTTASASTAVLRYGT